MTNKKNKRTIKDKIKSTYKNNKKIFNAIFVMILILIPLMFNIYIRTEPARLSITKNWAQESIDNSIKYQMLSNINSQYPNLPQSEKDRLANIEIEKYKKENSKEYNSQVEMLSTQYKNKIQNDNGQTYLIAIDPYHYYRRTLNIIEKGTVCDEIKNNECLDNHMLAPKGVVTKPDFHSAFQAKIYQIAHIFNKNITPLKTTFYSPVILMSLAVLFTFLVGWKLTNLFGGFFAAMLTVFHGALLGRTTAGFSDTDSYLVLFPMLITWLIIEAIQNKTTYKQITYSILAGLFTAIYSRAWIGWWYFGFILTIILISISLIKVIQKYLNKIQKLNLKKEGIILGTYLISLQMLGGLLNNWNVIIDMLKNPFKNLTIQNASNSSLWPNVLTTVAELNTQSLINIIPQIFFNSKIYGILFAITLFGIVSLILKNNKYSIGLKLYSIILGFILASKNFMNINSYLYLGLILTPIGLAILIKIFTEKDKTFIDTKKLFGALYLTAFLTLAIYSSTKGIRFILLGVSAASLGIGIGLYYIIKDLTKLSTKYLELEPIYSKTIFIILAILLLVAPLQQASAISKSEIPSMNDAWFNTLTKIKDNSQSNAIINSWWDFGHWFKQVADRRVTFDGASQTTPNAHWIGKALLTENPKMTIGILRMLDCGQNDAYEKIHKKLSQTESIDLINKIIIENKTTAKTILINNKFNEKEANEILQLTHCQAPEDYFITSEDMVGKSGVWAHFGAWDFKKAKQLDVYSNNCSNFNKIMKEEFNMNDNNILKLKNELRTLRNEKAKNTWISSWPGYMTQKPVNCNYNNNTNKITCNLGYNVGNNNGMTSILKSFEYNLNDHNSTINYIFVDGNGITRGETKGQPIEVNLALKDGFKTTKYKNPSIGYSFTIFKDKETYKLIISDPVLAKSTFTKLFFMNGLYMQDYFKHFSTETQFTGQKISVWKVQWNS